MDSVKSLELFCGTKSFTRAMQRRGADCLTLDNDCRFQPDYCMEILNFGRPQLPPRWKPDIIWASPPCTGFSSAAGGKYWIRRNGSWEAQSAEALYYLELIYKTLAIIRELKPRYWFIENPVSLLRNLPVFWGYHRDTVTYCQYGETRRKATDIWHNCQCWHPKPACKPGSSCHEYVPHQTHGGGVMRQSSSRVRGMIPTELCEEIAEAIYSSRKEVDNETGRH